MLCYWGNVLLRHDPFYREENHWILAIGSALSAIKKIWIRELDHLHAQSKKPIDLSPLILIRKTAYDTT